jgi:hypothetical protein
MWVVIATAFPLLAWLAAQNALSAESAILLGVSSPVVAYLTVAAMDLSLRVGTRSPLHGISWDCVDAVAIPLALLVSAAQTGLWVAILTVMALPLDRTGPVPRNRVYSAAVNGLALYVGGQLGMLVSHDLTGDLGVALAVTAGVVTFELFTCVGHMFFLPRGDPQLALILRPATVAIPLVVAIAISVTLSYQHAAHEAAVILALLPVFLIELMRHFGRTSIDLQERNRERDDILRAVIEAAELPRTSLAADVHDGPLQAVLACQAMLADIADGVDAGYGGRLGTRTRMAGGVGQGASDPCRRARS